MPDLTVTRLEYLLLLNIIYCQMKTRKAPESSKVTVVLSGEVNEMHTLWRPGADETIVCLHGLGCSVESFADIWKQANLGVYSVLCIDYLGHGKSDTPDGFSYSVADHARSVSSILAGLRHRPLHIVGHSLGGAVALHLSDSIKQSIISFTNVEGNLTSADCTYGSRRASSIPFDEFLRDVLPSFKESSPMWQQVGLNLAHPQAFFDTARSLVQLSDDGSLLDAFRTWAGKKAYVYGESNTDHPTVRAVEDMTSISIQDAGHFVMNDNPDAFYNELNTFIRG
jgi:pimeloyl-ACP methyl ester carboxylesterase